LLLLLRAVLMWLVLLVAMSLNGAVRTAVLQPWLGARFAGQASCLSGACAIFALTGFFTARLGPVDSRGLFGVGLLWLLLTVAFESLVGHYVAGLTWDAVWADYDLLQGRLWPVVLLVTLGSPWLWGLLRRGHEPANKPRRTR